MKDVFHDFMILLINVIPKLLQPIFAWLLMTDEILRFILGKATGIRYAKVSSYLKETGYVWESVYLYYYENN